MNRRFFFCVQALHGGVEGQRATQELNHSTSTFLSSEVFSGERSYQHEVQNTALGEGTAAPGVHLQMRAGGTVIRWSVPSRPRTPPRLRV